MSLSVSLDRFMFRRRTKTYICSNFVKEVWFALTGGIVNFDPKPGAFKGFKRLLSPRSPCLVLMSQFGKDPHIGVYIDGEIIHLAHSAPERFPVALAIRGFNDIRYYEQSNDNK